VDRAKLAIAVGALGRANANNFKNSLVNDQLSGVKRENLEGVANFVCSKLGLKDPAHCTNVKNAFQLMGLSDKGDAKLEEVSLNGAGFNSLYGYISGVRNSRGEVDIGFTIHHQEFKLSATPTAPSTLSTPYSSTRSPRPTRPSTRPSTTYRSTRPWTPTTSTTVEDPGFTVEETEAIRRHYSKYEALRTLKQENVIESISYV